MTGVIDESFTVEVPEIAKYEYVSASPSLTGTYTVAAQTVTLTYKKSNGTVKVHYVDYDGREIKTSIVMSGEIDTDFEVEVPEIENYKYVKASAELKGKYAQEEQEIILIYKAIEKTGRVIVKYEDLNGNKLKENDILTGKVDEDYKTTPIELEIYKLKEVVGEEEGKYKEEDTIVVYKYDKKEGRIIIIYQDPEGETIKPNDVVVGKIGEDYSIDRQIVDGYELVEVVGNEKGTYQLADQFVMYKYKKIEVPITVPQTGQSRIAYIIIGIIILLAIFGLIYIKWDDFKSKK